MTPPIRQTTGMTIMRTGFQVKPDKRTVPNPGPASSAHNSGSTSSIGQAVPFYPPLTSAIRFEGLRFKGILNEDYQVEHRIDEPVNAETVSAALRALVVRNAIKKAKGDNSSLKFFLEGSYTDWFVGTSRATLADVFSLIDRPVDVIVRQNIENEGIMALQSATGKRLMYDGARISLGPIQAGAPYMRNDDHAVRRELQTEYVRDLEYRLMQRAGIQDRRKLYYEDLNSARNYNALQALHFGEKGLVDGVLVGYDKVVTREALDAYIEVNGLKGDALAKFLANHLNINQIPAVAIADFSPGSLPQKSETSPIPDVSVYDEPSKVIAENKAKDADKEKSKKTEVPSDAKPAEKTEEKKEEAPKTLTFYTGYDKKEGFTQVDPEKIALKFKVKEKDIKPGRLNMNNLAGSRGFLEDDVIFFNEGFEDATAEQMTDALTALDKKKRGQENPSNIKIMVNSPGGSVSAGLDIRSTIAHMKTPVDVIVTGMAASCGAFLVSSATGYRMATPNARIMIHDAWWSRPRETDRHYNERIDRLDQASQAFVTAISQASGRPFKEVWEDMKIDVWLNPLESMFYGKKGLTDAILVGNNKVITKADVRRYLIKSMGGALKADKYLEKRLRSLREGNRNWKPEQHNEADPFDNPLKTIETIARTAAKPIETVKTLSRAVPKPNTSADHYVVALPHKPSGEGSVSDRIRSHLKSLRQSHESGPSK